MTIEEIEKELFEHIKEEYLVANDQHLLNREVNLVTTGILDSVSTLSLVDFAEQKFGIEFLPHEIDEDNIGTIEILAKFIEGKRNG